MELTGKILRWGNSAGVRLPANVFEKEFSEHDEVVVKIEKKKTVLEEIYGIGEKYGLRKISRAEFKKIRSELWGDM